MVMLQPLGKGSDLQVCKAISAALIIASINSDGMRNVLDCRQYGKL